MNDKSIDILEEGYQDLLEVYRESINKVQRRFETRKHEYLISHKKNPSKTEDYRSKNDVLEKMKKNNNDLQNIYNSMKEQVYISSEHIQSLDESSNKLQRLKEEFTQFTSLIGSGYKVMRSMKLKSTVLQFLYYFCFVCYFWIVLYIVNARF